MNHTKLKREIVVDPTDHERWCGPPDDDADHQQRFQEKKSEEVKEGVIIL